MSEHWTGSAFGLALRSELPLPGLVTGAGSSSDGADVRIALSREPGEPFEDAERLQEWHYPDGTLGLTIDHDERRGYRFFLYSAGVFELATDGSRLVVRPDRDFEEQWHWRRYLIGQVLPFAALLHGLEPFHASAVEVGGGGVLLAGGSGLGKSTLALNMHLAGAGFLADDSVAIEATSSGLLTHPAIATTKVRRGARDLLAEDDRGALLEMVSEDEHETRYRVRTPAGPLPLAAVCMLERGKEKGSLAATEGRADPWELLGSTFNDLVRDPSRLQAQLDLCGRIAEEVRFLRVRVGERPGPEAAARLTEHLAKLM
ncbi:MAG: hypothetical protein ACTHKT_08510 [Solirubrobacterales bacterium]